MAPGRADTLVRRTARDRQNGHCQLVGLEVIEVPSGVVTGSGVSSLVITVARGSPGLVAGAKAGGDTSAVKASGSNGTSGLIAGRQGVKYQ